MQARLDEVGHSSSETEAIRLRLEEELQKEQDQHAADLDERDFAMQQTQQTYQGQCSPLYRLLRRFTNTVIVNRQVGRAHIRYVVRQA